MGPKSGGRACRSFGVGRRERFCVGLSSDVVEKRAIDVLLVGECGHGRTSREGSRTTGCDRRSQGGQMRG